MEKQFPKNVRQIGNVCDEPKIYVEDYVDTYLNQLRQKALDNPAGAVLMGERHEQEGQEVVYILGALQMKELEVNGNDILIREDIWEYIEEEKKEMITSFGADETGKLVIDDDNVDELVSIFKIMLKSVCDKEETYEEGGAKVTSHVKSAIEVTDSKDSMQIIAEESMSSEYAGYTVGQSYSGIVTFTKQ